MDPNSATSQATAELRRIFGEEPPHPWLKHPNKAPKPQQFPEKPPYWQLHGTDASRTKVLFCGGLTIVMAFFAAVFMYFGNDWANAFKHRWGIGLVPPTMEEQAAIGEAKRELWAHGFTGISFNFDGNIYLKIKQDLDREKIYEAAFLELEYQSKK